MIKHVDGEYQHSRVKDSMDINKDKGEEVMKAKRQSKNQKRKLS